MNRKSAHRGYLPTSALRAAGGRASYLPTLALRAASGRASYLPTSRRFARPPAARAGTGTLTNRFRARARPSKIRGTLAQRVEVVAAARQCQPPPVTWQLRKSHPMLSLSLTHTHQLQQLICLGSPAGRRLRRTPNDRATYLPTYLGASRGLRPRELPTYF